MFIIDNYIDSKNRNLYYEIEKKTKINFIQYERWASITYDDLAEIYYAESGNPISCFTHELLHIKYYHLGLKMPKVEGADITDLFNILSHHKFYNEFIQLGFEPHLFVDQDYDEQTIKYVEQIIFELENNNRQAKEINLNQLLSMYITLKSPHYTGENISKLILRLKSMEEDLLFSKIDFILDEWRNNETFDVSLILAKLLKVYNLHDIVIYNNNGEKFLVKDV